MNLVRLGHLYTPLGAVPLAANKGDCSTALVVHVEEGEGATGRETLVNLAVFDHQGLAVHGYFDVEVVTKPSAGDIPQDEDTFHLSTECPWDR